MDTEPSILLAIKPLHYQGQQLFHEKWGAFIVDLHAQLQESGFEDADSNETLLLFRFNHPTAAITTLSHFISKTRSALKWQGSDKSLPLQSIVHLLQPETIGATPFRNPKAGLWELLSPEVIHISKALKSAWDLLMAKTTLPPCTFSNEGDGLFKLHFAASDSITLLERLLPCRAIASRGSERPCFYCGMLTHKPGQCPSKHLTLEHNGLTAVGYLPFDQIDLAYKKVFTNPESMNNILATGITPSQIRKQAELTVFVGFLDINLIYQLRFLWALTFSQYSKWQAVFKTEPAQPDNKNLQLGLDCLRVGKYKQAEEYLQQECHAKSAKRFSATIGLAFVSLESRGLADMRNFLELAKSMATQPKERVYIDLLLSRFYDLIGENWKARDLVKNILASQADCSEALYRKLQLEVKGNFIEEAYQLLRLLMLDQRTLYMAALLDPALLPIQTKVEDLLSTQYGVTSSSAQDLLIQADQGLTEIGLWLDSQDPKLASLKTSVDTLHKTFLRQSYFDVIDVEHRAQALLAANRQLKEAKLNELYEQLNQAKAAWEGNYRFWTCYGYKIFFKEFGKMLLPLEKPLQEASLLAKRNEGEAYQKAVQVLRKTGTVLAALEHMQARMNFVGMACDSSIIFIKKLAMAELGGAILVNALIFGLGQLPEGHALAALANDPLLQKQTFMLTAFLIAPFIALTLTIKDQLRR